MATLQQNRVLQKVFIMATGTVANVEQLAWLDSITSYSSGDPAGLALVLDGYFGAIEQQVGKAAILKIIAKNGLGLALDDANAEGLVQALPALGISSWSQLFTLLINLEDGLGRVLAQRTDAAMGFLDVLASTGKSTFLQGAAVTGAVWAQVQQIDATPASLQIATDGLAELASNLTATGIRGVVVDGYVAGATVFADIDGDGRLDPGEWRGQTDSSGGYELPAGVSAVKVVAYGGLDLFTGKPFTGVLSAPVGSTVVNPLTTLVQAIVENSPGTSLSQAVSLVQSALSLPSGLNLLGYDPFETLADSAASAQARATAIQVQASALQVANVIAVVANALSAAGGGGLQAAAESMMGTLAAALAGAQGPLALGDAATLTSMISTARAAAGSTLSSSLAPQLAQVVAAGNVAIAAAGTLADLSRAAVVTQSQVVDAVVQGVGVGSLASAISAYTGQNLQQSVAGATPWLVSPTVAVESYEPPTSGNDFRVGNPLNNLILGLEGNDSLYGGDGSDTLRGGLGNDLLDGGGNNSVVDVNLQFDFADYSDATGPVTVNLALGTGSGPGAGTDQLLAIEGVIGSPFNDTLVGGSTPDMLDGGAGSDLIDGGSNFDIVDYRKAPAGGVTVNLTTGAVSGAGGNDALISIEGVDGSISNDLLEGGTTTATQWFRGNGGNDTIRGGPGTDWIAYNQAPGAVQVSLVTNRSFGTDGEDIFSDIENLRGSNFGDLLEGNALGNVIEARGGNDTVIGNAGNDSLLGDAGDDDLRGGDDDDTLRGGAGNDTLDGGASVSGSYDRADYTNGSGAVSVNLATGIATGDGVGTDTLIGIEGILGSPFGDALTGSDATADYFLGGGGDDTIDGGEQFDVVDYFNALGAVSVNLATGSATGGAGNDLLIRIEGVFGSPFADTLVGSSGNEFLRGGGGDDLLDGGGGVDRAAFDSGPSGSGSISVSLRTGTATGAGFGTDLLVRIENLRGTNLDDQLEGDDGPNDVQARGGSDSVRGLGGDDTLRGEAGTDTLEGGGGADALFGGDSPDTLIGGDGADTLAGEAGADTFIIAGGHSEFASGMIDTISDFTPGSDRLDLPLAGTAPVGSGFGNFRTLAIASGASTDDVPSAAAAAAAALTLLGGETRYVYVYDADGGAAAAFLVGDLDTNGQPDLVIRLAGLGSASGLAYTDIV